VEYGGLLLLNQILTNLINSPLLSPTSTTTGLIFNNSTILKNDDEDALLSTHIYMELLQN